MKLKIVEYTPKKERNIMGEWVKEPTVYCICKESILPFHKKEYLKFTQLWGEYKWEQVRNWRAPIYVKFVDSVDYAMGLPNRESAIELLQDIEENPNKYLLSKTL